MFSDHAKVALAVETDHDFYQRKLFEKKFLKKWNFENDKVIEVDEETSFMPQTNRVSQKALFIEAKLPLSIGEFALQDKTKNRESTARMKIVTNNITVPLQVAPKQTRLPFGSKKKNITSRKVKVNHTK